MESIWQKDTELPAFPKFQGSCGTDVLIIGGGMAGILTAYFLNDSGAECILLEKNRILSGTTSGTTAKITFQHGLIYNKLIRKKGVESAGLYLQAHKSAFEMFENLCKNIDCDFEYRDSYIYSLDDREKLEQEISACEKIGFNAEYCENIPLPFETAGAVKFSNQAQFNPLKFGGELAKELSVYENSFVRDVKGNTAITDSGTVTAKYIIIATHFPFINTHGSYFLKLYQNRSNMIALENAENLNGIYLDESGKGFSFRNYKNYLIVGGESHRTGKQSKCWNELRDFSKRYYPDSEEYCFWSAQDCMSLDNTAYIGNYSSNTPYLFTASGFNKWGMTGSMLSAMILNDMICGKKNQFAELFSPSRSILKPQLFVNGFEALRNMLTLSAKRCTHLGCALKWNSSEHSWDCACHGSRFDENGHILENPANKDL